MIAALNHLCELTNTFFFGRCVGLDFVYWRLILLPPRWHLFQHKGRRWWTKPLWWKNTFSLWLLWRMSIHVRHFFSTESYSSSRTCFTNIVILFRQLINVCWIQFKFRLSFNFLKKQNDEKYLHEPKWARCVCVCRREAVGCESCVPCNWAVIAKLIRSDCFFGQWAWYFSSWCSFALNFFAWISIFSWWNQVENDARSQWEFWGK